MKNVWLETEISSLRDLIENIVNAIGFHKLPKIINHNLTYEYYSEKVFTHYVIPNINKNDLTLIWAVIEVAAIESFPNKSYTVRKGWEKQFYIKCYLIKKQNHIYKYSYQYEFSFPVYVNCPLNFLDLVCDGDGINTEWRKKVLQYWNQ